MEAKKISFGFSKITKKLNILPSKVNTKTETKVELIKCLEDQEIKLVEEKAEEQPLIIPLKESHKTSAALASLIKRRAVLLGEDEPEDIAATETQEPMTVTASGDSEDIEKRAARELLAEIHKNGGSDGSANNLVLPVVKPEDLPLDGAKESTLDDYDSIPIQDFGKAMLRGMGWTEPVKSNKKGGPPTGDTPMIRPKGMGLGADKALSKKPLLVAPEANEVLEVKRNAFVRILGGKHKDLYGQIEGFDDHAGRVIVKMAIGSAKEAFNEFLCQPVSKKEYAQYGKCINTLKYEEYKKKENEHVQIILTKDEKDSFHNKLKQEPTQFDEEDSKYKNNKDYKDDKRSNGNDRGYDKYDGMHRKRSEERDRRRELDNGEGISNRKKDKEPRNSNGSEEKDGRRERDNREGISDCRRDYEPRNSNRGEENDRRRDRDDREYSDRRRNYDKSDDRNRNRSEERERRRDDVRDRRDERYDFKSYRKHHEDDERSSRSDKRVSRKVYDNRKDSDRQGQCGTDYHAVIDLNDSSDSKSDSHAAKHKKSKKSKHSKKKSSKKTKKNKSKYHSDTSDSEAASTSDTSSATSSDSEEEKKKHKKKSKKSKKQRERSRSRGRR